MRISKTGPFAYFRWTRKAGTDCAAGEILSWSPDIDLHWRDQVEILYRRAVETLGEPARMDGKRRVARPTGWREIACLKIGFDLIVADWDECDSLELTKLSQWWSGQWPE